MAGEEWQIYKKHGFCVVDPIPFAPFQPTLLAG
jgi:hypothetical protein